MSQFVLPTVFSFLFVLSLFFSFLISDQMFVVIDPCPYAHALLLARGVCPCTWFILFSSGSVRARAHQAASSSQQRLERELLIFRLTI